MSRTRIVERDARSILTPTGGYLTGFTHSLQPYAGCQMSCEYCYVRELAVQRANPFGLAWSHWLVVKRNAPALLRGVAERGRLAGLRIFCASSTDPYVPAERVHRVTRGCVEVMVEHPPARLLLQTRSPLVLRDLELLVRIPTLRVSITVTTLDERVRRALEPDSPPPRLRIAALARLRAAGVPVQAAIAPLLPGDVDALASALDPAVDRVVVDDFFRGDGASGRRSRRAIERLRALGYPEWGEPGHADAAIERLRARLGTERVLVSQAGFVTP